MAWMLMQVAAGLRRLGHNVYYFEITSNWPYDPIRQMKVDDSNYALPYLARVAKGFGSVTAGLLGVAIQITNGSV
jgi:hypothetical protein